MAIQPGGDGSQATPYVINNSDGLAWSDFNTLNNNYNDKYITFADVHVDENGDFDISGTGTSADPYIVSTYREMLYCTGASNIHQCKMIAKDSTTREMTYRYDYEDPETHAVTSQYCRYNPAPTTIDWNDISDDYRSYIFIGNHCDMNGWTFLNFKVTTGGSHAGLFTCYYVSNNKADLNKLFFLNAQVKASPGEGDSELFDVKVRDCIMQIDVDASSIYSNRYFQFSYSSSYGYGFERNSLYLTVTGNCGFRFCYVSDMNITDSLVVIDADVRQFGHSGYSQDSGMSMVRSVIKGKVKFTANGGYSFFSTCNRSIIDVEYESENTPLPPRYTASLSVFNKEKVAWNDATGLTGVTSTELLSPTALQAAGLPIGVDT